MKPEVETVPRVSVSREINDIEKSHIYYYAEMVNFLNDIYVICAYIVMNVLFYLVSKIPWTRRATKAATEAAQWCKPHTLVPFPNYGQDII